MIVLVTGALGQDGRLLAGRLLAEGHRVVGLVRPQSLFDPNAPYPLASCDLGDAAAVTDLIGALGPDRVFHVAAAHHSSDVSPSADPDLWRAMTEVNFLATNHLIQAILTRAPACRLIYAASSHMYRPTDEDRAIDEDSPRDPPGWYGLTKAWSMDAIRFARERNGLHGSGAILFNHESPRRPEAFVSRKITMAAARIKLGLANSLHLRNIGAVADWFDAEDAVDAMIRMGEAAEPGDYVVGSGRLSSVRTMVEAAFEATGLNWREHVTWDADSARPALRADIARIGRQLGWAPRTPIVEVIRRMVAADLTRLDRTTSAPRA